MGRKRTPLYAVCLIMFPVAFAGFVIGFGCPVWQTYDSGNNGLWQSCLEDIIKNCTRLDFDTGGDWMIGVRAVEIFALVVLVVAGLDLIYENCSSVFRGRDLVERLAPGVMCILGGFGGIAGVIVFAVKLNEQSPVDVTYGWAMALTAVGSGLAVIIGVGFCVSGFFLEKRAGGPPEKPKMNGSGPYLTSNNEDYEMRYTNQGYKEDSLWQQPKDNLPGYAMYNGLVDRPGNRMSLPPGPSAVDPMPRAGPSMQAKQQQYYSLSDDRVLDPGFDLSEGYQPSRARTAPREDPYSRGARDDPYNHGGRDDPYYRGGREDPYSRGGRDDPYSRGGRDDPYSRGGREDPYSRGAGREDPYNRGAAPRAGYNDPYGFDRGIPTGGANRASRDSFYRPGRF